MHDEDPSDEDVDRFGDDSGFCPDCGREVWDEAWQCPHCGAVIEGRILRDPPNTAGSRISAKSVLALIATIIVILILSQIR